MTEHTGHWSEITVIRLKEPEGEGHFSPRFGIINRRTGEIHDAYSALGVGVLITELITENNAYRGSEHDANYNRAEDCFEQAVRKGEVSGRGRQQSADSAGNIVFKVPPLIPLMPKK